MLGQDVVDLAILREHSVRGVPEGGGRRAATWRILLGYLPATRKSWSSIPLLLFSILNLQHSSTKPLSSRSSILGQQRALYHQLVEEIIIANPEANSPVVEDHPLNPNPASNWQVLNFLTGPY